MYKHLLRTCTAIVPLIKLFVWWRFGSGSRCRYLCGLLRFSNAELCTERMAYNTVCVTCQTDYTGVYFSRTLTMSELSRNLFRVKFSLACLIY